MNRSDWMHDLRAVDEVVIVSGEKMQVDDDMRGWWTIIYTFAVVLWHLVTATINALDRSNK